jgi:hypothetical protein
VLAISGRLGRKVEIISNVNAFAGEVELLRGDHNDNRNTLGVYLRSNWVLQLLVCSIKYFRAPPSTMCRSRIKTSHKGWASC